MPKYQSLHLNRLADAVGSGFRFMNGYYILEKVNGEKRNSVVDSVTMIVDISDPLSYILQKNAWNCRRPTLGTLKLDSISYIDVFKRLRILLMKFSQETAIDSYDMRLNSSM